MEFIILPVRKNSDAVKDFSRIYNGLMGTGENEYASYLWKFVSTAEVSKENPYIEIENFPDLSR